MLLRIFKNKEVQSNAILRLKSNEILGAKCCFYFINRFQVIEVIWENILKYQLIEYLLLQQIKILNFV